jgi:hypothetical protein
MVNLHNKSLIRLVCCLSLGVVGLAVLAACLIFLNDVWWPRMDIDCEVVSARVLYDKKKRSAEPRLEMKLSTSSASFVIQPYKWGAFEIATDTNVMEAFSVGYVALRPLPPKSPRLQKVILTRSPVTLEINLTNYYSFRLKSVPIKKGDPVVLALRCVNFGHFSRMLFVNAKFE